MRLGESDHYVAEPPKTVPFESDDTLFLYSDGLTDLKDADGNALGKPRLKEVLHEALVKKTGVLETREHIRSLITAQMQEEFPDDDITFAIMRLKS
jgi:serine phosphatase RsbU (regulator of sigma subunit)